MRWWNTVNYVYLGAGGGIYVLNIANPSFPYKVADIKTHGIVWGLVVSGSYLYVANGPSGLVILDISNPPSPRLIGSCDTPGEAQSVALAGDYACVADGEAGLQIINISNLPSPFLAGSCILSDYARDVSVAGGYAYVANGSSGLQIIDISDPDSAFLVGRYDTPDLAYGVSVSGDYAYVADWKAGLQIIDISNPASPSLAGMCDTPHWAWGVVVVEGYAYVADTWSGLQIIDISHSDSASLVGSYDTPCSAIDVFVSGNYAYVAGHCAGLQIIDISNQAKPSLTGSYNTPGSATGVAVIGDRAYVADGSSGLLIIDVSNPDSAFLVGSYDTPDSAIRVFVDEDYAYVADRLSGLQIIDISKPTSLWRVGSYDTPREALGVTASGDYVYIADEDCGLIILEYKDVTPPSIPTLVSPLDGSATNDLTPTFIWNASTDILGTINYYTLEYADNPDLPGATSMQVAGTTYTLPSPLPDTIYYWKVKATDKASNESNWSETWNFIFDTQPPVFSETKVWADTSFCGPYTVTSIVTDALSGVDSVFLYYRFNEEDWESTPMEFTDSLYQAEIPEVDEIDTTGIDYYLEAIDVATNKATDPSGAPANSYSFMRVGIEEKPSKIPSVFVLYQNHPNPFVSTTTIKFALPKESQASLKIYDMSGRLVKTLLDKGLEAGYHTVEWNPEYFPSGIYFYTIQVHTDLETHTGLGTGNYTETRKMILLR